MYKEIELYHSPRQQCLSEFLWPEGEPEMTFFESAFLCGLIKQKRPQKIVEVGIAAGGTTAIILKCLELLGIEGECEMYSVDLSEHYYRGHGEKSGYLAEELLACGKTQFQHNFLLGKLLPEVIDEIGSEIDFVILDTVHAMPGELLDFLTVFPYLKSDACVVLHDIALNHYDTLSLFSYANQVLLRCVVADKYFVADDSRTSKYPNIGAFDINADTGKNIDDLFHALTINWMYRLQPLHFELYRKHYARHYGNEKASLFSAIYEMQNSTYSKMQEMKADIRREAQIEIINTKTYRVGRFLTRWQKKLNESITCRNIF